MPIYEYLCPKCNRVYSFLAKRPRETKQPVCPKCGCAEMRKMISRFAVTGVTKKSKRDGGDSAASGGPDDRSVASGDGGQDPDPFDDPRVEREMMRLLDAAENMDENDPRQLGRLMRRMAEITGEKLEPEMEEAVRRLEAGEDPEKIEEDMDELLGGDEYEAGGGGPTYDDDLYPL